jgi:DNA topoisomerase VI subunit B
MTSPLGIRLRRASGDPVSTLPAPTLERVTFRTSRLLDFFSSKELIAQTGHSEDEWPLVVEKELVDNALDVCEEAGVAPVISVSVDEDGIEVSDNGPGLPHETLTGVLDFSIRVSSREAYVAPDRGAQGNALKTIIAMPFVLDGTEGQVDVEALGQRHLIKLAVDRIREQPVIDLSSAPSNVTKGTVLRIHWPDSASSLAESEERFLQIARAYAVLNPHLSLTVDWFGARTEISATAPQWPKWRPSDPTSPHWYTIEHLERLIAAHITDDADNGRERPLREFVAEFRGLSSSAKQKSIAAAIDMPRARLSDMWDGNQPNTAAIEALLAAMQAESRPVKPADLGVIGREHLRGRLAEMGCVTESFDYRKKEGIHDGVPWVVEAAFGWLGEGSTSDRQLITGVNWSPGIVNPFRELGYRESLDSILERQWAGWPEPVVVVVHLACARVEYTDRGKSAVVIPFALASEIRDLVTGVTKKWAKQRKAEERSAAAAANRRSVFTLARYTIKDAAYEIMEAAYLKASGNGLLPANARQIMYAARGYIQKRTGQPLKDDYFTQTLLPDYVAAYRVDWDVVFDARGHFTEPHSRTTVPLGTLAVRRYLAEAGQQQATDLGLPLMPSDFPTKGPANRFAAVLFIEKEGFAEILKKARIAERYDIAVMSTKGMSVTASRLLVDRLHVPLLVLHDFDQSGFSILGTLRHSTRRYRFAGISDVIDLGLTLADIEQYGLEAEEQRLTQATSTLRRNGANPADIAFLQRNRRVELNMLTSDELIELLETKLTGIGITKVVPDAELLASAYRRACQIGILNRALGDAADDARQQAAEIDVPDLLVDRVRAYLEEHPEEPWDSAIASLADHVLPRAQRDALPGQATSPDAADRD